MKVLMICQDVRVDRRIVLQAQTLTEGGYRVAILARAAPEGPIPEGETDGGIPVHRLRVEGRDPRFRWLFSLSRAAGRAGYDSAVNLARLWGALAANNTFNVLALPVAIRACADVYHAHDLINLPVARRAAQARGAKLVYDAHELFSEIDNPWIKVRRRYWRRTEGRLLPHCLLATTVNEFIAEEMARRYGVPAPEVIYNAPRKPAGFDPGYNAPRKPAGFDPGARGNHLHQALGLPHERRIVLYQGWMAEGRGLEELVLGAAGLRGANAVLALMGYGEHKPRLEEIARAHDLGDVVRFLDAVPQADLVAYCASATVGVIPYRPVDLNNYYSSPNKLFDFIQARTPILANDLPFLRKVIAGRDLGMVAPMTTPDSVGAAMLDILSRSGDPATASRWQTNLDQAASVYNWEHEGEKLLRLFYERVGRPRA
jgi:glycosyltransferase involved in cell wall biosynthesis